jgi:hypothetical protein
LAGDQNGAEEKEKGKVKELKIVYFINEILLP